MSRDMSAAQFKAALKRNGMAPEFAGYVKVATTANGSALSVYARNAGPRRRDQIAYLLREQERFISAEAKAGCRP